MKKTNSSDNKHIYINFLSLGILIGLVLFALIRFSTYKPGEHTHYHANWSVWINGEQQKFTDSTFYEETITCSAQDDTNDPSHRAHMHGGERDIIHVHADGVTWNQFLENIDSSAQPNYLRIRDNSNIDNQNNRISYILNGKQIDSLNGLLIQSEDKLLINYGNEPAEILQQRYNSIENKAAEYNTKPDPASCSGDHESTIWDRFQSIWK